MKRLMEFSKLLAMGLSLVVFATIAPVEPTIAGSYVSDDYDESDYDETEFDYPDDGMYWGDSSAESSYLDVGCSAYTEAGAYFVNCNGSAIYSSDMISDAWAIVWWQWTGGGTPTGGTLTYSYSVSGSNSASGNADRDAAQGLSSAFSYGSNSASGVDGVSAIACGSVQAGANGLADSIVDPPECATTDEEDDNEFEWYKARNAWELEVEDEEEEISSGTSLVGFSVSVNCWASSDANALTTEEASASAYATSHSVAEADGSASFP